MAVFDVTLARTATIFVEADTEEEAKFIAECQPESNCSWSDEWNATDACKIAENLSEMGEDAALVTREPFSKAMMVADKYGALFLCPTTDGRLCLMPYDLISTEENFLDQVAVELASYGYSTEIIAGGNAGEIIPLASTYKQDKRFLLVGLPDAIAFRFE